MLKTYTIACAEVDETISSVAREHLSGATPHPKHWDGTVEAVVLFADGRAAIVESVEAVTKHIGWAPEGVVPDGFRVTADGEVYRCWRKAA